MYFQLKIDERINHIWFFPDDSGKNKKKNYIYITENNKIVVKGLAIIKSNCSLLSKKIFEILKPDIIKNNDIKFPKKYIAGLMEAELQKDITMIATEFNVRKPEKYAVKTSLPYAISAKYGDGRHMLLRNKRVGVGRGVKYCSMEESKQLTLNDLDLEVVWNELAPFILKNKGLGEW